MANFNRRPEYVRKSQTERLSCFVKVSEMKSSFEGPTRTLNITKEGTNELEDRSLEITQTKTQRGGNRGGIGRTQQKEHSRAVI